MQEILTLLACFDDLQNQAKSIKTKRYGKDIDQVHEELKRQAEGLPRIRQTDTTVQEAEAEELPGKAQSTI